MLAGPIRCLLVGSFTLALDALASVLEPDFDARVAALDVQAALDSAAALSPNVVVIETQTNGPGEEIASRLSRTHPESRVLFLGDPRDTAMPGRTISKSCDLSEFVRVVLAETGFARGPPETGQAAGRSQPGDDLLSDRERQVLELLLSGLRMKEVARRLGISPRTVAFHKYRVMERLKLQTPLELVQYGLRTGLLRATPEKSDPR